MAYVINSDFDGKSDTPDSDDEKRDEPRPWWPPAWRRADCLHLPPHLAALCAEHGRGAA